MTEKSECDSAHKCKDFFVHHVQPSSGTHLSSYSYPYSKVCHEKVKAAHTVKEFPTISEDWSFHNVFTTPRHWFLSWARQIQFTFCNPTSLKYIFNITFPPTLYSSKWYLFFSVIAYHRNVAGFLTCPTCATCPTNLNLFDVFIAMLLDEEYKPWSISLCGFIHGLVTSYNLGSDNLVSNVFSDTYYTPMVFLLM